MKKLLQIKEMWNSSTGMMLLILCSIFTRVGAQTSTQNYIVTWTATVPVTDIGLIKSKPLSDVKLSVQYFDVLDTPIQTIAKQCTRRTSNEASGDLVTFQLYDSFGRLKDAKDNDGNVVKKYDYHYQGQ